MTEEKKISDIIIEMHADNKSLLLYLKAIDANIKNLMNRVSILEKTIIKNNVNDVLSKQLQDQLEKSGPSSEVVSLGGGIEDPPQEKQIIKKIKKQESFLDGISVVQKVQYSSGAPVFNANVDFLNPENSQVMFSTKTNTAGRWSKVIPPGKYNIRISRKSSGKNYPQVDLLVPVEINNTESSVELEMVTAQ